MRRAAAEVARRLDSLVRRWRESEIADGDVPVGVGGVDEGFDETDPVAAVKVTWRTRCKGAE